MKKMIFAAAIVLVLFSCKKSSGPGNIVAINTISATVDGKSYVFNTRPDFYTGIDTTESYFDGSAEDSATSYLDVYFQTLGKPLTTGTYLSGTGDSLYNAYLEFDSSGGNDYYGSTLKVSDAPITIKVTTFDGNQVQGTFQGTVYENNDTTESSVVITNGKFNGTRQ
ncbi:MAG TPA: hypothetical protein VK559_03185 [Ferruginibacter sp.]|nr:hypothetical protein [Ferruginibacter sp.]